MTTKDDIISAIEQMSVLDLADLVVVITRRRKCPVLPPILDGIIWTQSGLVIGLGLP